MSDGLFDFEEKQTNCSYCSRPFDERGKCPWCDPPKVTNTRAKAMSRTTDPSTSKRAAAAARYRTGTHKALILLAHGNNPQGLTDEEAAPASGLTYHQAERRCCDLRNDGMLMPNGQERAGTSGSMMRVSVLTDLGFATLRTMKEHDAHQSGSVPIPTDASPGCPRCGRDHYFPECPNHTHVWTVYDKHGFTEWCRECGEAR
jgi:hypothetical protein